MTPRSQERDVQLVPSGIRIGGEVVPLLAGAVHYWRLDPRDWRACLEATKSLGLRLVDVYVPWGIHEIAPGMIDLGERDPQKDVAKFLRMAHEIGLYAIVRPGPHINAEMTYFGLPERIVWDPACQARGPSGSPVMLPMLPFAFPVPSYASAAFHDETSRFFRALGPALTELRWPDGPIVMMQVDNEGALYFRDGAYDQDYHPDAIALYREFLREKYQTLEALEAAYGGIAGDDARFATIEPPKRFDATKASELARHLDWAEFHEILLTRAFERFAGALDAAGLGGLPTSHNLPPGQEATPLNAARITKSIDLVGLDYYCAANEDSRRIISRRTSELAVRCEAQGVPAFACEMGVGFPPFFPPLEERDSEFTILAALAYGLRGFNLYMAVERDRWIGAPIDPHGRLRPLAAFYRKLSVALEATKFTSLKRHTPVRILTPRSERRLSRVTHAFGPLSGAFFAVLGAGAKESALEDDLGLGYAPSIEPDMFVRTFEAALEERGVPFAHIGGEDRRQSIEGTKWLICATGGAMNPRLFGRLEGAAEAGALVTLGPREPLLDGTFRPLAEPLAMGRLSKRESEVPVTMGDDPASVKAAVARAIVELDLPTYACTPEGVFATVHHDDAGVLRVLFLVNPGPSDLVARVTIGDKIACATDVIEDEAFIAHRGAFEIRLKPHTVRMLAIA